MACSRRTDRDPLINTMSFSFTMSLEALTSTECIVKTDRLKAVVDLACLGGYYRGPLAHGHEHIARPPGRSACPGRCGNAWAWSPNSPMSPQMNTRLRPLSPPTDLRISRALAMEAGLAL